MLLWIHDNGVLGSTCDIMKQHKINIAIMTVVTTLTT